LPNNFKINLEFINDVDDDALQWTKLKNNVQDYKSNPMLARLVGTPEDSQRQSLLWTPGRPEPYRLAISEQDFVIIEQLYKKDDVIAGAINSMAREGGFPVQRFLRDRNESLSSLAGNTIYVGTAKQLTEQLLQPRQLLVARLVYASGIGPLYERPGTKGVFMGMQTRNGVRWASGVPYRVDGLEGMELLMPLSAERLCFLVVSEVQELSADLREWSKRALLLWLKLHRRGHKGDVRDKDSVDQRMNYGVDSDRQALLGTVEANAIGCRRGGKKIKGGALKPNKIPKQKKGGLLEGIFKFDLNY